MYYAPYLHTRSIFVYIQTCQIFNFCYYTNRLILLKKPHPSTNSPKCFGDWVTNTPFRKCVFILIRLHHTTTKDTVQRGRLAAKNTAFINPIKSRLIQAVAFTAVISCYLTVPNAPPEFLPGCNLPFPRSTSFWVLATKVLDQVTKPFLSWMLNASEDPQSSFLSFITRRHDRDQRCRDGSIK